MICLDSSAWIDYLRGGSHEAEIDGLLEGRDQVVTPTIVVYEVLKFFLREGGEASARSARMTMRSTRIVAPGESTAALAARLSLDHRLPMADALILATAREQGAQVVTLDGHFADIPDAIYLSPDDTRAPTDGSAAEK